jgi:hypothetical protein
MPAYDLNSKVIHIFSILAIIIVVIFLYRRYEDKVYKYGNMNKSLQDYLLDNVTNLDKSKKPILWLHVPYEYNSRRWSSFGSRSSLDLNQPYLFLTVRTIISKCDNSFTICIIDDHSFDKLLPGWSINMSKVANPISDKLRKLALMKILHKYGGMICPISLVCFQNLIGLYEKGTVNDKMFVCENVDKNVTSASFDFYPDLGFCGAPRECHLVGQLIEFMQRTISQDFTAASEFLGEFDRWVYKKVKENKINLINGVDVGTKTVSNKPILLEDLMANHYLNLYPQAYGIWVPMNQILKRRSFEWFARLSEKQVLESDTILGQYILINMPPNTEGNVLEPISNQDIKKEFVGFWQVPSDAPYYGLKPNFLGDNLQMSQVPY